MSAEPVVMVRSVAAMHRLAAELAGEVKSGQVLLLQGELGSGKTTFVQGLAQSLGVEERVTSPSFTVASEYVVLGHPELTRLVHVDLYRLEAGNLDQDAAVRDTLERVGEEGRLTVVEWSERLGSYTPAEGLRVQFSHTDNPTMRQVIMTRNDPAS